MGTTVIAIAGGSGAGKSTLSAELQSMINVRSPCVVVPLEAYFLDWTQTSIAERAQINFDEPSALDTGLLVSDLAALRAGHSVHRPWYDMSKHRRGEGTVLVEPTDIIIVDGHLALAVDELLALLDLRVFVDTPVDERLRRRLARDVAHRGRTEQSVLDQWNRTVQPMYQEHIAPSADRADLTLSGLETVQAMAQRVMAVVDVHRTSGQG